ncbi:MAG: MarR family transcriptional regulator, partial [Oscillospiraceae bacterium]|nr:MarR family transcriptional regulator [Oscillospiraceae bacterium]
MFPMFELLAKEKPHLHKRLSQEQYLPFLKNMQDICGADFSCKAAEMTPSEMSLCYCVQHLSRKNGGALPTVAETAAALNVSVPAISRTLKNLEAKEYIQRVADDTDRRIVHILLTKKGETLLLENFRAVSDVMDRVL